MNEARERAVWKDLRHGSAEAESAPAEKYLTFYIDGQLYCLPTSQVVEIIRMQPVTPLPNLPDYVKGVINLRGKVVPVIDMRLRFRKEEKAYDPHTSTVIVEDGENTVGLIVDAVKDVRDVTADRISEAPKPQKNAGGGFVRGIVTLESEAAMLLDLTKVLTHRGAQSGRETDESQQTRRRAAGQPVA